MEMSSPEWFRGRSAKSAAKADEAEKQRQIKVIQNAGQVDVARVDHSHATADLMAETLGNIDEMSPEQFKIRIDTVVKTMNFSDEELGTSPEQILDAAQDEHMETTSAARETVRRSGDDAVKATARFEGIVETASGYETRPPGSEKGPLGVAVAVFLLEFLGAFMFFKSIGVFVSAAFPGWLRQILPGGVAAVITGLGTVGVFQAAKMTGRGLAASRAAKAEGRSAGGEMVFGLTFATLALAYQVIFGAIRVATDSADAGTKTWLASLALVSMISALIAFVWEMLVAASTPPKDGSSRVSTRANDQATIEQVQNAEYLLNELAPRQLKAAEAKALRIERGRYQALLPAVQAYGVLELEQVVQAKLTEIKEKLEVLVSELGDTSYTDLRAKAREQHASAPVRRLDVA